MSATFMVLTQEVPIMYVEMSYLNLSSWLCIWKMPFWGLKAVTGFFVY